MRGPCDLVRVVVTGAAGFIGSHLCEHLLGDGHEVVGLDCFEAHYDRSFKVANLTSLVARPAFTFLELDLRHDPLDEALEGADAVVNEAARPGLPQSWSELRTYQDCNLLGAGRLVEASLRAGVGRFVQASTSSVYGLEAVGNEDQPTRPISPYGVTKLAAEHLIWAHAAEHGLPAVVLRYFSIYGPRQRPDMAYRIFCHALINRQPIDVFDDGSQTRSNTYVTDCVAATAAALERGTVGETYNVGGGAEISLVDAISILADELGVEPVLRFGPRRAGDQRRTAADVSRAERDLGWTPTVQPDEGLRRQARWVRTLSVEPPIGSVPAP